jgi:hypothetical protein
MRILTLTVSCFLILLLCNGCAIKTFTDVETTKVIDEEDIQDYLNNSATRKILLEVGERINRLRF